jgi:hypothetical protein
VDIASLTKRILVTMTTSALMLSPFSIAAAVPASPIPGHVQQEQRGLYPMGFNLEVAHLNGFEVVTLPDGAQTSVPREQAAAVRVGLARPTGPVVKPQEVRTLAQDYKYGECGYSFVSMTALGGSKASMDTGAHVRADWHSIWDVNWRVNIADAGGNSQQTGYTDNGGHDFAPAARTLSLTRGAASAGVPYYSYVILTDGTLCYSYSPSVTITIK